MSYLKINNVTKKYKNSLALNDVSFDLDKGKTLVIIGNSGSGKTTLLRILNALEISDSGSIKLLDETITDTKSLNNIFGLVFQGFSLFPQYTVLDNIMLAVKNKLKKTYKKDDYKLKYQEELNYALELLNRFKLSDKIKSYPLGLSGGEAQRVAIIRALIMKPKILCFDEPTSALDPKLKKEVALLINELKAMGLTIIVVTHEMELAKVIADKIIYMENGRIIETGDHKILLNPATNELKNFLSLEY